jgi:hypothetical protein
MARKPLSDKTVAGNVMKRGTGGINLDVCRVGLHGEDTSRKLSHKQSWKQTSPAGSGTVDNSWKKGRWPANLALTYPENEYTLRDDVTPEQLHQLAEWMNENAER